ncbi:hypothetical protein ACWDWV_00310 [Streptosporangium sandarakinum]
MQLTSPACDALTLVAAILNSRLSPGSSWRAEIIALSKTSHMYGRLERITLYKVLHEDLPGADFSADDLTDDTVDATLTYLNRHHAEPGTGWHSYGLELNTEPRSIPGDRDFIEVLGHIEFWKLTDAAAADVGLA